MQRAGKRGGHGAEGEKEERMRNIGVSRGCRREGRRGEGEGRTEGVSKEGGNRREEAPFKKCV